VIAATTVGCVARDSEGDKGERGISSEGKSKGNFGAVGEVGVGGRGGIVDWGESGDESGKDEEL
jgi:hypothetical protein